jgi:hypothetical protein
MRRHLIYIALLCTYAISAATPPSILNVSDHEAYQLQPDLSALGISKARYTQTAPPSSSIWALNQTCPGQCRFLGPPALNIEYATTLATGEYPINGSPSDAPVYPSIPYQLINQSSTSSTSITSLDQQNYAALVASSIVYSIAYCGSPNAADYPPVAFVTVLPNNAPSNTALGESRCGYAPGIEFSIPVTGGTWTPINNHTGSGDVSSPSATTEFMTAVLAALKYNHSNWTWGDIKSVLRITASNWPTGYAVYNSSGPAFGYGNLNYVDANAYSGTIYLQPPGMTLASHGNSVTITLYPFLQSRRRHESVYIVATGFSMPAPENGNEYTRAEIASLVNGGHLTTVTTNAGRAAIPTLDYAPSVSATFQFIAFTEDAAGNASRAETFSIQAVAVTRVGDVSGMKTFRTR